MRQSSAIVVGRAMSRNSTSVCPDSRLIPAAVDLHPLIESLADFVHFRFHFFAEILGGDDGNEGDQRDENNIFDQALPGFARAAFLDCHWWSSSVGQSKRYAAAYAVQGLFGARAG